MINQEKISELESQEAILAVLLYDPDLHQDLSNYLNRAVRSLDRYTGDSINVIHFEGNAVEIETKSLLKQRIPKRSSGGYEVRMMTAADSLFEEKNFEEIEIVTRRIELVANLSDQFLNGEHWRMPSLTFFSSFSSNSWYTIDLKDEDNEAISDLILKLSKNAKDAWKGHSLQKSPELQQRVREQVFQRFEPSLKQTTLKNKLKKIAGNSTVLAVLGAAVGLT